MLSRRQLLIQLAASPSLLALSAVPWKLELGGITVCNGAPNALAKGKGGGNGNGKGGGNGGGDGGGNGGRNGGGNGGGNSSEGNRNGKSTGKSTGDASSVDAPDSPNSPAIDVRHQDGIQEAIRSGRYIMRDRQGRVIIDRKATLQDQSRLRRFAK